MPFMQKFHNNIKIQKESKDKKKKKNWCHLRKNV